MPSMRRSALQELPLEKFQQPVVAPNSSLKPINPNKRPLSPGSPNLFSPTKRRILTAEGIFSPGKTVKSPLSMLKEGYASPARFSSVLAGPESPARVLDFGSPKNIAGDPQKRTISDAPGGNATPTKQRSSARLAPSPELKPRTVQPTRHTMVYDHDLPNEMAAGCSADPTFYLFPRDPPPRPDPYSIHYPGFQVFQDPHLVVFPSNASKDSMSMMEDDDELHKENVWVQPRVAKKVAPVSGVGPGPGPSTKFKPVSGTPSRVSGTALSPNTKLSGKVHGMSLASNDKKARRQMLKDELDFDHDHDDDD